MVLKMDSLYVNSNNYFRGGSKWIEIKLVYLGDIQLFGYLTADCIVNYLMYVHL